MDRSLLRRELDLMRLLLRPAEAAELLGISRAKAYQMLAAGSLPSVNVGGVKRVPRQALEAWIANELHNQADGGV